MSKRKFISLEKKKKKSSSKVEKREQKSSTKVEKREQIWNSSPWQKALRIEVGEIGFCIVSITSLDSPSKIWQTRACVEP